MPKSKLIINEVSLSVRLGCSERERAVPQLVRIKVELNFNSPPAGIKTDRLEDTVCYDVLTGRMKEYCHNREFHLVEHLAQGLFETIKAQIPASVSPALAVTKVNPPVDEITGGVTFILEDL